MSSELGPKSVNSATTNIYTALTNLRDRRDWLVRSHAAHKARVETVTNVVTGNWFVEWPDLSQSSEAPTVANIVELGVDHWASIGGAMLPSIRVPVNKTADRRGEKSAVRKRERRVRELWESGNASELGALWWGDYAGTGAAYMGVWTNFEESDTAKRNPYLMRFDPRHCYVTKDSRGNVTELLVARKITKAELQNEYPEYKQIFGKSGEDEIEEWFWYMPDRVQHILVDVGTEGAKANRNVVLVDEEWDLGFVPAWEVVRPTFDGKRRGVFDQSIHILRTMQRLMLMTIQSTEENAFPAISTFDAVNPEDFGPGAVIQMRSSEGRIERLGPANHFDVKDLVARLADDATKQAVYPQQLSGSPGASIVSARGINASMGALDARLALAHKQFEVGFGKVSGFLLAFDETFCDGDKTIVGDERDTSDSEPYRPSKHVKGAWVVNCTYGLGAGSDPANIEMRLNMNLSNGLISRATARAQLPFLEDPEEEPIKQLREAFQDAVISGIMAASGQGDPTMALEALKLLNTDDKSLDEIMEKLGKVMAPPDQQGAPGGDPAAAAVQGAESLARGGIPGSADQAPPAQGMGLPQMGQLLGQDSRQVS